MPFLFLSKDFFFFLDKSLKDFYKYPHCAWKIKKNSFRVIPQFFDIEVWASTLLIFFSSFLFMQLIKPFHVILYIVLIGSIGFDQKFIDLSYGNSRDRLIIYCVIHCCFHREYCILLISSFTCVLLILRDFYLYYFISC